MLCQQYKLPGVKTVRGSDVERSLLRRSWCQPAPIVGPSGPSISCQEGVEDIFTAVLVSEDARHFTTAIALANVVTYTLVIAFGLAALSNAAIQRYRGKLASLGAFYVLPMLALPSLCGSAIDSSCRCDSERCWADFKYLLSVFSPPLPSCCRRLPLLRNGKVPRDSLAVFRQ